jgi:hypothetical protein
MIMCYEDHTVIFDDNSVIKKVRSVGVFDYYLTFYNAHCSPQA